MMKLEPDAIRVLERNRARALEERDRMGHQVAELDRQIEALNILLGGDEVSTAPKNAPAESATNVKVRMGSLFLSARSTSEAIRLALQEYGQPVSPKQLSQFMIDRGFRRNGAKPLSLYVGPELFRMAKKEGSPVKSVGKGRYEYRESE